MQSMKTARRYNVFGPLRRTAVCAFTIALLLALSFLAPQAGADEEAAPGGEPRFTVELIVFSYRAEDSAGNEVFVPEKPALVPDAEEELPADVAQNSFSDKPDERPGELPRELPDPATGEEARDEDPESKRIELQRLDPENHGMDDIYRKLEQLDAYQPILHVAWTQTTPPKELSPAVRLRALGNAPPGLDGSVTLYRGRYLHLVVDLALDAAGNAGQQNMTATDRLIAYGDERTRDYDDSGEPDLMRGQPVRYRIFEDRIMKPGDLRYFDHPRFGIVARVTKPPAAAALRDPVSGSD
jgi:hypothetical protein